VCMYVYIIYLYVCMYVRIVCMYVYIIYLYVCMYVCMYSRTLFRCPPAHQPNRAVTN